MRLRYMFVTGDVYEIKNEEGVGKKMLLRIGKEQKNEKQKGAHMRGNKHPMRTDVPLTYS